MFIEKPSAAKTKIPIKKEPGIAMPTNSPERQPSAPTIIIMTNSIALMTLFWRSVSMRWICNDRSCENVIFTS